MFYKKLKKEKKKKEIIKQVDVEYKEGVSIKVHFIVLHINEKSLLQKLYYFLAMHFFLRP